MAKVDLWRPKDEWESTILCNRGLCLGRQNGSGLCGKHYRRWKARQRIWQWLAARFTKVETPQIQAPEQEVYVPGQWQ